MIFKPLLDDHKHPIVAPCVSCGFARVLTMIQVGNNRHAFTLCMICLRKFQTLLNQNLPELPANANPPEPSSIKI